MKKKLALVLGVIMVFSSAGCGGKNAANNNEKADIKWIMCGPGTQKDSEVVWEKAAEKLKTYSGAENINLDVEVFSGADYKQKFLLMQTSGANLDIVQTYCLDDATEIKNNSFIPIDEYIDKSDGLKKALPEWIWDFALFDGKHYFVPNYQLLANVDYSFVTQKELSDQYWDTKKAQETMFGEATYTDTCWDVIEGYLDNLSAAGKLQLGYKPLDSLTHTLQKGYEDVGSRFAIKMDDPSHKLIYMDEVPERINSFKRVAQLYQKGYIRKDIASLSGDDNALGKKDGYSLWHEGFRLLPELYKSSLASCETKCGFPIGVVMTKDYEYIPKVNAAGGFAISQSSKNPDKAFRVIELLNTEEGKDFYNLMSFGIEGQHYKKVSDNVIEPIGYVGQGSSSSNYGLWKWNVGNTKFAYITSTENITPELMDEANNSDTAVHSSLTGFVADTSSIETEIAQVNTVFEEYKALNLGTYADVDKTYKEYIAKANKAGKEKIRAELQKQVDEFFKNKK